MSSLAKILTSLLKFLAELKDRAIAALKEAWYSEPALVLSALASAVVALAAAFGVVISPSKAELIVGMLAPIILGALFRTQAKPVNRARALALARIGSRRHVIGVYFWRRTALGARRRDERLQARALAEGGSDWPPTDEAQRQELYERFSGAVTPMSKLRVAKATHSERGRWVILVIA